MIIEILQLMTSLILGLLVGSLLTEAMILVPYWRSMDKKDFLRLHHTLGPQLYKYFAPLTISATVIPVVTAVVSVTFTTVPNWLSIIPAIIVLIMLVLYFAYFKSANNSFAMGFIGTDDLVAELERWAKWHWLRVVIGTGAFFVSLLVLLKVHL